ncbi:hypothetical protein HYH03_012851 [Edaphochlamys debaryana]|uniref:Importin subunit alpha n=1 Tax=Edaphochlamys debaryana TaxID=47281 RepID=A0A836BTG9_9CHLO|nr:hypothetical protein HYH03_012851 [Edaphochlamys debaryana]|eukprot:KAG2488531.1 hypothetical protein HYH03_012851 [Edaphochlamys debaryana]
MAAPNPSCPAFRTWKGVARRQAWRAQEAAKTSPFQPKLNIYVPADLQSVVAPRPREYSQDDLEPAFAALRANDRCQWLPATTAIRQALSKTEGPPIDQVLGSGVLPRLAYFMTLTDVPELEVQAAWAVCNVASGSGVHCRAVVDSGALRPAVERLGCANPELREQVAWLLGNVVGDCLDLRQACLDAGMLEPLLAAARAESYVKAQRQHCWLLCNLVRSKPRPRHVVTAVLPVLAYLGASLTDSEALTDAFWALSYIAEDTPAEVAMASLAVVARAEDALRQHDTKPSSLVQAAAQLLGSLCGGSALPTQVVLDTGALTHGLRRVLLSSEQPGLIKQAAFAVANIAAGTRAQARAVSSAGLLPLLCAAYDRHEAAQELRSEVVWALANMAGKEDSYSLASAVVAAGGCRVLGSHLAARAWSAEGRDVRAVQAAAEGLLCIARAGSRPGTAGWDGSNPHVAAFIEQGVYDYIRTALEQDLAPKAAERLERLLEEFPEPV